MSQFHLVWVVGVNACYQVESMFMAQISPNGSYTQREIAVFADSYPIVYDFNRVVAQCFDALPGGKLHNVFGAYAVDAIHYHGLAETMGRRVDLGIVDECTG